MEWSNANGEATGRRGKGGEVEPPAAVNPRMVSRGVRGREKVGRGFGIRKVEP